MSNPNPQPYRNPTVAPFFTCHQCGSGSWSISLGLGAWAFIVLDQVNKVNKARQSQRAVPQPPTVILEGRSNGDLLQT